MELNKEFLEENDDIIINELNIFAELKGINISLKNEIYENNDNCCSYVYIHITLDTNKIFYVGIGRKKDYKRAYDVSSRSNHWKNVVKKHGHKIKILFYNKTWEEACEIEKLLILFYGRKDLGLGYLVNLTDGGDGSLGGIKTGDLKKKYGSQNLGKKHTIEHINKNREANLGEKNGFYGKKHSEETKIYLSKINKGKIIPEKTKAILRSQKTSDKHPSSKIVLCLENGVFFDSGKDAAIAFNMVHSTLKSKLNGREKNNTKLIYC